MLEAVKRTRLYKDIMTQILELISEGKLKSGDWLPPERELAQNLKVSRASLREAISALDAQGLVQSRSGTGTMVIATSLDTVIQTFASSIIKERNSLLDALEMRALLEPQVAYLAASRATSDDIQQMQQILQSQESSIPGKAENVKNDIVFHLCVAHATQNSALIRLTKAIGHILGETRRQYLQSPERFQRSVVAHRNIFNAIKRRDAGAAQDAMHQHILDVQHVLETFAREGSMID